MRLTAENVVILKPHNKLDNIDMGSGDVVLLKWQGKVGITIFV